MLGVRFGLARCSRPRDTHKFCAFRRPQKPIFWSTELQRREQSNTTLQRHCCMLFYSRSIVRQYKERCDNTALSHSSESHAMRSDQACSGVQQGCGETAPAVDNTCIRQACLHSLHGQSDVGAFRTLLRVRLKHKVLCPVALITKEEPLIVRATPIEQLPQPSHCAYSAFATCTPHHTVSCHASLLAETVARRVGQRGHLRRGTNTRGTLRRSGWFLSFRFATK